MRFRTVLLPVLACLALAAPALAASLGPIDEKRKKVNVTLAHRDHVHIGLSLAGARRRTSFWAARR